MVVLHSNVISPFMQLGSLLEVLGILMFADWILDETNASAIGGIIVVDPLRRHVGFHLYQCL